MSTVDEATDMIRLREWQRRRLTDYGNCPAFPTRGPENVTILAYFYRTDEQVEEQFPYTICAIYETWRHCGLMRTVLVVNKISPLVRAFRDRYPEWVSVQEESSLTPGSVDVMSVDCNLKLVSRFETPYVLIVQDDGFPLRPGLEHFLGKADYLGSPFRRRSWIGYLASILLRECPANGGLSLRTKKICRLASEYWHKYYKDRPFMPEQVEDVFYTQELVRRFMGYKFRTRIANSRLASDFSYDGCLRENIIPSPFGFHSARAFCDLQRLKAGVA